MRSLDPIVFNLVDTLTLITTYTCTAACQECCFGCTPKVKGRQSGEDLLARIKEASETFPNLKLVVFSGGECFLLKEDLFEAITRASELGLSTRCVTNAYWGKSPTFAKTTAKRLVEAGIDEINISTGIDHQKWVSQEAVINAARALANQGISTLVTVEQDSAEHGVLNSIRQDETICEFLKDGNSKFHLISNSWMPFNHDSLGRDESLISSDLVLGPCDQIFHNVVVTPHGHLSACCGLTLEHIPEMKLGVLDGNNMGALYVSQTDDFLKFWIRTEGPGSILKKTLPPETAEQLLSECNHICQACAVLHLSKEAKDAITNSWEEHVPRVMTQFTAQSSRELYRRKIDVELRS